VRAAWRRPRPAAGRRTQAGEACRAPAAAPLRRGAAGSEHSCASLTAATAFGFGRATRDSRRARHTRRPRARSPHAVRRSPSARLVVLGKSHPQQLVGFFLELDERVRDRELPRELGVPLRQREQLPLVLVELRLAPRLLRREACSATRRELLAPRRQVGAVDALPPKQRLERAAPRKHKPPSRARTRPRSFT